MNKYDKMRTAMVGFFKGKQYYSVLSNLYFAESHYSGTRKDVHTPNFYHPLCMLAYARNLSLQNISEIKLYNSILGHDLYEDYGLLLPESPLTELALSKTGKTTDFYYNELLESVYTALVKGIDRIDNLSTMVGVFSHEKQVSYIHETEKFVIPLINAAKIKYPSEEQSFRMIKHNLILLVDMWTGLQ